MEDVYVGHRQTTMTYKVVAGRKHCDGIELVGIDDFDEGVGAPARPKNDHPPAACLPLPRILAQPGEASVVQIDVIRRIGEAFGDDLGAGQARTRDRRHRRGRRGLGAVCGARLLWRGLWRSRGRCLRRWYGTRRRADGRMSPPWHGAGEHRLQEARAVLLRGAGRRPHPVVCDVHACA
jgi:hypothetical protein